MKDTTGWFLQETLKNRGKKNPKNPLPLPLPEKIFGIHLVSEIMANCLMYRLLWYYYYVTPDKNVYALISMNMRKNNQWLGKINKLYFL